MQLPGTPGQQARHFSYDASGTITTGGTPQLLLPEARSRSLLFVQNLSDANMNLQIGTAFATATISGGKVTACTVVNGGFGFTYAPAIAFLGGGPLKSDGRTPNLTVAAVGQPGWDAPDQAAIAHCVLTAGVITSIVVDDGGSGYLAAPYVQIRNSLRDPKGVADPTIAGSTGFLLVANGGSLTLNGSACPTDPVAISCATTGKAFACKYMT